MLLGETHDAPTAAAEAGGGLRSETIGALGFL